MGGVSDVAPPWKSRNRCPIPVVGSGSVGSRADSARRSAAGNGPHVRRSWRSRARAAQEKSGGLRRRLHSPPLAHPPPGKELAVSAKNLYLTVLVFVSGAAVLAVELLGTRVLGPF